MSPASCGTEAGIGTILPGVEMIRIGPGGPSARASPQTANSGAQERATIATARAQVLLRRRWLTLALSAVRHPSLESSSEKVKPIQRRRIGFGAMTTVREATFDLFRAHGMTTMFGNPGSTELPMLADYPADFRYVLGLQEAVVVGMADGYAQASGRTTVVNLHTAPGVGNAMGGIFNAQANHSPLLITAGQQARAQITLQANLTNRDATRMPHPLVKWSYEPPRAEDVPLALARGAHLAGLAPRGPVFVSLPMDDWYAEVDEADAKAAIERKVGGRAVADPEAVRALAERLDAASNPVLVAG